MIRTTDDGAVRTITIDRPERRNALTPAALKALETAVTDVAARVIELRGAGSAFCAGADLDVVADLAADAAAGTTDQAAAFARLGQRVARAIETSDAVVVAGIDGPARGGGLEIALACDLRIATPAASFAEPGVTFGLFGAWGGTHRLTATVGRSHARDIALSGRVVDAEQALDMGLVSRVVDTPRSVAEEIADCERETLTRLKSLMNTAETADRTIQEEREANVFAALVDANADTLQS
ncbi:enoyl-CoA hydratase/isomerase family protein [Halocatena pleomorpha]|uniref:Enoyl-CoA hydratase/isomerase family protein n=1 Tax=Halocatena pleomorpha TaxID=1785090 RepID=A0A3P3RJX3_9EURY|nr:enoyl-CoA hydratase/isomerase family protein [Halocatena pleomorpha]RRJ33140.1 enoyl-CoA hydratase/isomerase family protein [Halocatena pleomorpha]